MNSKDKSLNEIEIKNIKKDKKDFEELQNDFHTLYGIGESIVIKKDKLIKANNEITLTYYYKENTQINESNLTVYNIDLHGNIHEVEKVKLDVRNKTITFSTDKEGTYCIKEKVKKIQLKDNKETSKNKELHKKAKTKNHEGNKEEDKVYKKVLSEVKKDNTKINAKENKNEKIKVSENVVSRNIDDENKNNKDTRKNKDTSKKQNNEYVQDSQVNKEEKREIIPEENKIVQPSTKETQVKKETVNNDNEKIKVTEEKSEGFTKDKQVLQKNSEENKKEKVLQKPSEESKKEDIEENILDTRKDESKIDIKEKNNTIKKEEKQQEEKQENNQNIENQANKNLAENKVDILDDKEEDSLESDKILNEKTRVIPKEKKSKLENIDVFDIAVAGLLKDDKQELKVEDLEKYKKISSNKNGIWIVEKDRESINNIANDFASKQYYIDKKGFLKAVEDSLEDPKKSKTYSELLDKLINSDKKIIIGRSNGWYEYDVEDDEIVNKEFTETNKGVNIGSIDDNQLVIIKQEDIEKDKKETNIAFVLFHELVHASREERDKKSRLEEELFAGDIENKVREELGYPLRDTSELEKLYKLSDEAYNEELRKAILFYGSFNGIAPGELVPGGFTYSNNAKVVGDELYLRDANGNTISGRKVSNGDNITVLDVGYTKQLALVQYPIGDPKNNIVRQGYVTNATNIIKYFNQGAWHNGSTSEEVLDENGGHLGSLDPYESATPLYKRNGMTHVVYNTNKGTNTKSGFVRYAGGSGGSSGGSTGGGSFNGITPGEIVPGGFTYPNNAKVVGDDLYLRDSNGNRISGRAVSNGDNITVLDVGYTKQLDLVQYPVGKSEDNVVRQGYVTNATNIIKYFNEGAWHNGSTPEEVLNENGGHLGSLDPYESATPLYKKDGMTHVVYNTNKGQNTKSGFVRYAGGAGTSDTNISIPYTSHSQATCEQYGTSGKGRPLNVYKIGNGSKVLFAGFAIHGWEDNWNNDGIALVKIANELIGRIGDYKSQHNGLHGWTVYIAPCMNPDGVIVNGNKNGPGRRTVTTGIDMNRCFPYKFYQQSEPRYHTGPTPLGAPEAVALKNLVERIHSKTSEMIVIDCHGWMGFTQAENNTTGKYFGNQFGFDHKYRDSSGFFSTWANSLSHTKGVLLEYPESTHSYNDVINGNYVGKTFNGIINILKDHPGSGDSSSGTSGGSGATGGSGSTSGSETSYNANGEVINVQSYLNVRQGPGTNYNSIGQLHQGDKVTIVTKDSLWCKIKYGSGDGYVHSDYIKEIGNTNSIEKKPPIETETPTFETISIYKKGRVTVDTLEVKGKASFSANTIYKLKRNDNVNIVEKIQGWHNWYKINTGSGEGYALARNIDILNEAAPPPIETNTPTFETIPMNKKGRVTIDTLEVKGKASFSTNTIYKLKRNNDVNIVEKIQGWHNWYKINTGSGEGYVLARDIEILSETEKSNTGLQYTKDSLEQIVGGRYSDKVTLLGTAGEIGLAFTGLGIVQNIRDITYDLQHLDGSFSSIGNLVLDTVSVLPVVGIIKYGKEVKVLLKSEKGGLEAVSSFTKAGREVKAGELAEYISACFTENTLIYTESGYKPIKDIKIGDKVYSKDLNTNQVELKAVKNTSIKEKSKLVYITIENDIIETTEEHPFYVKDKGWIIAGNLTKDDKLVTNDKEVNIDKIEIKTLDKPVKVYNFEVEDWHNYFVGTSRVLVHNSCSVTEMATEATGRMNMAGKIHPVSGVKFDASGFPKFKSEYDMHLDPVDYLKSRSTHFDRASKSLYAEIQSDSELASKFTQNEIDIFKEGGVPKRFTWHHSQETGLMQLVDRTLHRQTGHNGGFSIWGPGNK